MNVESLHKVFFSQILVASISNNERSQWFSLGTLVSSINKTDHHDITEILLKVALNTINQTKPKPFFSMLRC
jgi:hypothetical protein